jgi:hypothetical protein
VDVNLLDESGSSAIALARASGSPDVCALFDASARVHARAER